MQKVAPQLYVYLKSENGRRVGNCYQNTTKGEWILRQKYGMLRLSSFEWERYCSNCSKESIGGDKIAVFYRNSLPVHYELGQYHEMAGKNIILRRWRQEYGWKE